MSVSSLPLATLQTPNVLGSVRTLAGREVRAKGWGTGRGSDAFFLRSAESRRRDREAPDEERAGVGRPGLRDRMTP
jgi:hypothetical protein